MFNIDLFETNLKTQKIGKKNYYYASTNSTNTQVWTIFNKYKKEGIVTIANEQTQGRGRGTKKWFSKKNKSLICSFLIKQKYSNKKIGLHSILIPVGIINGIKKTINKKLQLKWPNDIMYNNKKIGGILIESKKNNDTFYFNVGFGLNVNEGENDFTSSIQKIASSLKIITGYEIQREILLSNIINSIDKLLMSNNDKTIIQDWLSYCNHINQTISIKYNGNIVNARFIKINNNGQAILNYNDKKITYDGEIFRI